jgi:hypothetical protein
MEQSDRDLLAAQAATRRANEAAAQREPHDLQRERPALERLRIRCECGRLQCATMIELTRLEYTSARRNARLFLVKPGHGVPSLVHVIFSSAHYELVESHARLQDE